MSELSREFKDPYTDDVVLGERVATAAEVDAAIDRMVVELNRFYEGRTPLILSVMVGGLIPTARLLPKLTFEFDLDYLHATRYRGRTSGQELSWRAEPTASLAGREVLVVDDILDEGVTLFAVVENLRERGAIEVCTAVLFKKVHGRNTTMPQADFTGMQLPDRYVFGCGMDFHGRYRHLEEIYALGS